ncbi:MAG: ArnT family glycosyltransferase [Myxococcota bacterium]
MPRSLLQRLGLAGGECDARLVWGLLLACLTLYALGYAAFYPRVLTNTDEVEYLEETRALLETGSVVVPKEDPRTGLMRKTVPGDYPVGMVALMAPFVATLGWRGAFLASFLALLVAVLATARWLQQEKRSPIFALILLGFPALLVVGRLALSDGARTAVAAVGLLLFFRGLDRERARSWLASGFVAGAALSLRESAVLPFIPLFVGSVLRRDRGWGWLLLGGLAGTALHGLSNAFVFGDAMFVRGERFYPFAPETLLERLPLYLFGLLVLVPGGLALGLAYRGRRRQELLATIVLIFLFYLFQAFGNVESGFAKRLVIALRYFAPLLPVLAFTMSESMPRLLGAALTRVQDAAQLQRWAGAAVLLWIGGVALACFVVHPVMHRWNATQARLRDAIEQHVPKDAVLVANREALDKFVNGYERPFLTLNRHELEPGDLEAVRARHGSFWIALLDRSDSDFWRRDAAENASFLGTLAWPLEPVSDLAVTSTDRLRIWRAPGPASAEGAQDGRP